MKKGSRRAFVICAAGVFLATVAAFLVAVTDGHLRLDDWGYTYGCPFVKDGFSVANVLRAVADPANGAIWMPLTYATYMLDISLFGGGWQVHHAVNVPLHGLNAALAFAFLLRVLRARDAGEGWKPALVCAIAALTWSLHPMRAEAVAWVAARKEELWTLFALAGLTQWIGFARRGGRLRYVAAFALFALACLSKPTALCFPLLAFLVARYVRPGAGPRLLAYAPYLLVSALLGALTVFSQTHPTGFDRIDIYDTTFAWRVLNAAVSLGLYVFRTVVPLNVGFDYRAVFEGWPLDGATGLAALAVASGLAWLALRHRATHDASALAVGWFVVSLLPALGVFGIVGDHAYADRYAYLPSVAFAFCVAAAALRLSGRLRPSVRWGLALAVLAGEVALAQPVARSYADDVKAFSRVLARDPDHWRALSILGCEYCARLGRMDEGVAMLRRSQRLSPRPSTAASLAYVLSLRGAEGDFAEVRRLGRKVAARPETDEGGMMLDALGVVAMRTGEDALAARYLAASLRAVRRGHSTDHTRLNLALCLANLGKRAEAAQMLNGLSATGGQGVRARAREALAALLAGNKRRFEWK